MEATAAFCVESLLLLQVWAPAPEWGLLKKQKEGKDNILFVPGLEAQAWETQFLISWNPTKKKYGMWDCPRNTVLTLWPGQDFLSVHFSVLIFKTVILIADRTPAEAF